MLGCLSSAVCQGQWSQLTVPTAANLLSVHATGDSVWVSGANGTVLHSTDGGAGWTVCTVPGRLAHTDLPAIQGADALTAVVMTGGKGERSRLFRTTDGCKTWALVFTNPEEKSSFDSLRRITAKQFYLLGEPIQGKFAMYLSQDAGATWFIADDPGLDAEEGETAAGSTLAAQGAFLYFGTGGLKPMVHLTYAKCNPATPDAGCTIAWGRSPIAVGAAALHGLAVRTLTSMSGASTNEMVAVGSAEGAPGGLVAYARGDHPAWHLAETPPAAANLAVAFDGETQNWIAIGPTGTDVSADGGKHWRHAKALPTATPVDSGWAALSLPFAVGEHGKVGRLDRTALKP